VLSTSLARAKSGVALRLPPHSMTRWQTIALVAGAGGVTVSLAMKTLLAKAKISGLASCEMIFSNCQTYG